MDKHAKKLTEEVNNKGNHAFKSFLKDLLGELVKKYPNDMQLGEKVRAFYYMLQEK